MDRCHKEDALSVRNLEVRDLENHREGFHHENAAHDEENQFLTCNDGHRTQCTAKRQSAHVAHKHLGRISVVPKEA